MQKLSERGEEMSGRTEFTAAEWARLERRVLAVYRGPVAVRNQRRRNEGDQVIRARRLLAGTVNYSARGRRLSPRVGEWVFSPEGAFAHTFSPDAVVESVAFVLGWPTHGRLFAQREFLVVRASGLDAAAAALIEAARSAGHGPVEAWAALDEAFARWTRAYVEAMEAAGLRARVPRLRDGRVRCAMEEAERWPAGVWRRPGEVAAHAGLSRGQLNRLFVRETGRSLDAYLKARRLERARAWLSDGKTAKEAGAACGFATAPSFPKWFKRESGETPRAFGRGGWR